MIAEGRMDKSFLSQNKVRSLALLASTVAVLVFIYANSLQTGGTSAEESYGIYDLLSSMFGFLPFFTHTFVRKAAHFLEYALLGTHVSRLLFSLGCRARRVMTYAMLFCFAASVSDEILQVFVPSRYASMLDVMIDTAGALWGIICIILCQAVRKRKRG